MIDGKVCSVLTDTLYQQKCYKCGVTPKMMNDKLKDLSELKNHLGFLLSI